MLQDISLPRVIGVKSEYQLLGDLSNIYASQFLVDYPGQNDYFAPPSPPHQLPSESWLAIFREATWTPGAMEVDDYDAFTAYTRDEHGINLYARYREAMDTKLSLSLVSKRWRALATEFLYEYIVIKNGHHACEIRDALEGSSVETLAGQRAYGSWTLRMDLALEDVHVWEDWHTAAMVGILQNCPNLAVFSTAFCTAEAYLFYPSTFLQALAPLRDLKNLRRLELRGDVSFLNDLVSEVSESTEVLWLLPPAKGSRRNESLSLCLPKLRVLKNNFIDESFTLDWHMPCLESYLTDEIVHFHQHLQTHGVRLRCLGVPNIAFGPPAFPSCPHLLEVSLRFGGIPWYILTVPHRTSASKVSLSTTGLTFRARSRGTTTRTDPRFTA
ncbi:hypothetical protein OE88DRAFT_1653705 [Heliocybe sulcata]|uniref:Uncharacterized protein n=1 Tax=Heliocybe sulcata TaxID=5364 RepID=A0A5C3NGA0_9AGAM|nr:hypothetical protein OE88DRAFT_1653705 [Heliocybe sulcata]